MRVRAPGHARGGAAGGRRPPRRRACASSRSARGTASPASRWRPACSSTSRDLAGVHRRGCRDRPGDARRRHATCTSCPSCSHPYGLALPNMGDIDRADDRGGDLDRHARHRRSASAGSRRRSWPRRSSPATGELLTVSETERPELLPAVRLGLGALGVLVDVTLQLRAARSCCTRSRSPSRSAPVLDEWERRVRGRRPLRVLLVPAHRDGAHEDEHATAERCAAHAAGPRVALARRRAARQRPSSRRSATSAGRARD